MARKSISAREWQELFDAAIDVMILISPTFEILQINRAGCEGTGKKQEEIIGKKCYEVMHGLHSPIAGCPCQDMIRTKKAEVSEITQEGRHYIATASPILDKNNELLASAHTVRDTTEHKQAEERAREAGVLKELEKLRTELLANISHELRTPLATIKGYSTMLVDYDTRLEHDEKQQYLKLIDEATDRQSELIDQLIDLSRLETSLIEIKKTTTDIYKLLRKVVVESQVRVPQRQMVLNLPEGLPALVPTNISQRMVLATYSPN